MGVVAVQASTTGIIPNTQGLGKAISQQLPTFILIETGDTLATVLVSGYLNESKQAFQIPYTNQMIALVYTTDQGSVWLQIKVTGTSPAFVYSLVGTTNVSTVFEASNGTAALPSFTFASDTTTGMYLASAGNLGLTAAGAQVANIAATGVAVTGLVSATTTLAAGTGISSAAGNIAATTGNLIAGSSGHAGIVSSFPGTGAGTLQLVAVNNTTHNSIISNTTSGQDTTLSFADVGSAAGRFLVANTATPFTSTHIPAASGTGGLMVDSGLAVVAGALTGLVSFGNAVALTTPTADASANADATTSAVAMSSNTAGVLGFVNTLPRYATGSFTLGQVLAAYTTPVELIPAPGANFMVVILQFCLELIYGSAAYANGGAAYLQYGATAHGTNYATPVAGIPAAIFTGLAASTAVSALGNINTTTGLATSVAGNAAITYTNATANFITGTGGSARWYAWYQIVPIT